MIATIVIGLVVGVIARFLMPGRDPMGFVMTGILGIVGAVVAGWLGRALGYYQPGQPAGFVASIVGAVIVLAIYRSVATRRASSRTSATTPGAAEEQRRERSAAGRR